MLGMYVSCLLTLWMKQPSGKPSVEQKIRAVCKVTEVMDLVGPVNAPWRPVILDCSEDIGWLKVDAVNPVEAYMTFKERGECEF